MKTKIALLAFGVFLFASSATAADLRVVTEQGLIRTDRRFLAPVIARAAYGDLLVSDSQRGDWYHVRYQGSQGWIHKSQVSTRRYVPTGTSRAPEATRDEVALAGKGFTADVEKTYRTKNPGLNYNLVQKVESFRVSDEALQAFIRAGNLREGGGGQ